MSFTDEPQVKVTARIPRALYEEFARLLPMHGQKQRFFTRIIEYVVEKAHSKNSEVIEFIDRVKREI